MLENEELFGYEDDEEIIENAKRKLAEKTEKEILQELLIRMDAITYAIQGHMEDHIDFEDLSEVESKINNLEDDIQSMNNNLFGLYEMSLEDDE